MMKLRHILTATIAWMLLAGPVLAQGAGQLQPGQAWGVPLGAAAGPAQSIAIRTKLTASQTYNVLASGGSDTNCSGLVNVVDPGTGAIPRACSFATPQHAISVVLYALDLNDQTVTINLSGFFLSGISCSGTFVGGGSSSLLGSGSVVINAPATSSITATSANAISASQGCNLTITGQNNLTLSTVTTGISLIAYDDGSIAFGGLIFGAAATGHIQAGWVDSGSGSALTSGPGHIYASGSYSITGGAGFHLHAVTVGSLIEIGNGVTGTLTGTPAFSNWFMGITKGLVYFDGTGGLSGSATGQRYLVHNGGTFCCGSRTSIPGSAAGVVAGGGVFIASADSDSDTGAVNTIYTNNSVPATPAAGYGTSYFDSTGLRLHDINSNGTVGTTVVGDSGATNNFLTGINASTGAISKAQPTIANISGWGASVASALGNGANTSGGFPTVPVANAQLANSSTTVAGQACALGGSCAVATTNLSDVSSGTCTWSDTSGAVLTLTGTSNCKWQKLGNWVKVYGTVSYPSTSNASAAQIGFVGAPTVPNQTYAALPSAIKVSTGGVGAVVAVVIANSTNFNIWGNAAVANVTNASLGGGSETLTINLEYPAS